MEYFLELKKKLLNVYLLLLLFLFFQLGIPSASSGRHF